MSDPDRWYYLDGSTPQGPVDGSVLRDWLAGGQLHPAIQVARVGWNTWMPAGEALAPAQAAPQPLIPALPPLPGPGSTPQPQPARPQPQAQIQALVQPQAQQPRLHVVEPSAAAPAVVPGWAAQPVQQPGAAQVAVELRCVAGPDTGRSFWIGPSTVSIDRRSGLLDPYLGEVHAILLPDGRVQLRVASGHAMAFQGQTLAQVEMTAGQQVQIGSSLWEVGAAPMRVGDLLASLGNRLNQLASTEKLEGFSLREMFSEVFHSRTPEEIDEYFLAGTAKTTPPLSEVHTGWPKPWLFGRVLLFLGVVYLVLFFATQQFLNPKLLPALILMGSVAVPFATLILFYELNTPRNVSFRRVLTCFFLGGVVSIFVSLIGFSVADLSWLGASSAGIIEEIGKLTTVILIVRGARDRYILNGLLFGAAVGAGFAAFESAGYAFEAMLDPSGNLALGAAVWSIGIRAFLSPFAHVAWTALAAGALWRTRGGQPFSPAMLFDGRFLKTFLIPVGLHMIWNSPIPSPLWSKHLLLGVVSWYVLFGLVQQGLRQVKEEQTAAAKQQIETTRTFMRLVS